jgi:hypothetical protein
MRRAAALALAVVALGGAFYVGSLPLGPAGLKPACTRVGSVLNLENCAEPASRATWQFPVAGVIAALGLAGAVGGLKRT